MTDLWQRFWSKVDASGDCWLWTGCKSHGYGYISIGNHKMKRTHRIAYQMVVGEVPEGMCVLHKCDNRACVNPKHLFLGTLKDNTQDMMQKGRCRARPNHAPFPAGGKHPDARLDEKSVAQIREKRQHGERVDGIAKEYGVCPSHIYRICNGARWSVSQTADQ